MVRRVCRKNNKLHILVKCSLHQKMVGQTGFEPATPCTPCMCATRLRYCPLPCGVGGTIMRGLGVGKYLFLW